MKNKKNPAPVSSAPAEDDIRKYAYHLYVQNGCVPGRDLENWLEAKACLCACIPKSESHLRLHRRIQHPADGVITLESLEAKNLAS